MFVFVFLSLFPFLICMIRHNRQEAKTALKESINIQKMIVSHRPLATIKPPCPHPVAKSLPCSQAPGHPASSESTCSILQRPCPVCLPFEKPHTSSRCYWHEGYTGVGEPKAKAVLGTQKDTALAGGGPGWPRELKMLPPDYRWGDPI